jgi:hypothetical protein
MPASIADARWLRAPPTGEPLVMSKHEERERRRGEHNELGYRNVDEDAQHDERGSQGPGPEERPIEDDERSDDRA